MMSATTKNEQNVNSLDHQCPVCNEMATKRCAACNQRWYCSKEHQVIDWQKNKTECMKHRKSENKDHESDKPSDQSSPSFPDYNQDESKMMQSRKMSKALQYQKQQLAKHPGIDYILINDNVEMGVEFSGSDIGGAICCLMFKMCQTRAESGDAHSVGMVYQALWRQLKTPLLRKKRKYYGVHDLRKQMNREYGVTVHWSEYEKM